MKRVEQSPTSPDFVQDPYAFYKKMRPHGDLFWWTDYDMPMAVSHRAVNTILRDRRFGRPDPEDPNNAAPAHLKSFHRLEKHSLLQLEPPDHTRIRALIVRGFSSQSIQERAPEISQLADYYIDRFTEGPVDIIDAFARDLPVLVISRLLGVPDEVAPKLQAWSNAMVKMYLPHHSKEDELAAEAASSAFVDYLTQFVDMRRKNPGSDFLTNLIAAEEMGKRLSTDELTSTIVLLLNAGHEATIHTLGNSIHTILKTGMDLTALRPTFVEATVNELLRYSPPLHMFMRYANERVELFGHTFERGEKVGLLLAAANRDPAVFPDADVFDPTRPPGAHLSFGAGIHFCQGAPLARLQLQIVLPLLFARHPGLSLLEEPTFGNHYHFHGLEKLMVKT